MTVLREEHVCLNMLSENVKFDGSTSISQFFAVKMTIWIVYLKFSDTTRQRNICDQCRNGLFRRSWLSGHSPTNQVTWGLPPSGGIDELPPLDPSPWRWLVNKAGMGSADRHPGGIRDGIHLLTDLGCCMPRRFWTKVYRGGC